MKQAIVILNAGSSSLKFSMYRVENNDLCPVVKGQIEGIGTSPKFKAKNPQGRTLSETQPRATEGRFGHPEAFAFLLNWLLEHFQGEFEVIGVGHRVAHGGADFIEPTRIDLDVIDKLEKLVPLVPLHQPSNLAAIKAVMQLRPELPQVACFDTAFHQGRARVTERMGLPDAMFKQGLRRWGFHGLSYESIARSFRQLAPRAAAGRVIAAHLGSGASLCAMKNGRCVDTTMGFSALDGLPMGTRCGSLDPGVLLYLIRAGWTAQKLEDLLYKKSGLLGISGVSNDVRDLLASSEPLAIEAIDYFVYRIQREIGSLTAALGGLDALIFTAGVGENSPAIRQRVCDGAAWLNINLDSDANRANQKCISPKDQTPSVWAIPTDEEGVIASHTFALVSPMKYGPSTRSVGA
jgi:acetate kinase